MRIGRVGWIAAILVSAGLIGFPGGGGARAATSTAADFALTASPNTISAGPGTTVTVSVGVQKVGSAGNVTLSLGGSGVLSTGSHPDRVQYYFHPNPVAAGASGTLTLKIGAQVSAGTYSLKVGGREGTFHHVVPLQLTVTSTSAPPPPPTSTPPPPPTSTPPPPPPPPSGTADFTLTPSPTGVSADQGKTVTVSVDVKKVGSAGNVVLSLGGGPLATGDRPDRIRYSFSPNPVAAGGFSTLTLKVGANVPANTYTLKVGGREGTIHHVVPLQVTVTSSSTPPPPPPTSVPPPPPPTSVPPPPPPPPPTGEVRYVAPNGSDSNPGTYQSPWKTVQYAVDHLQPGYTLRLRGGTYYQSDIKVSVAGTASEPITITNQPGEQVNIDGRFPAFSDDPADAWTVYDSSDPDGVIYESKKTYDVGDQVYGFFGADNGSWCLIPYERWEPFSTTNENYTDTGNYFVASGLYAKSDGHIYVRLKRNVFQRQRGSKIPANLDPRKTPLIVFGDNEGFDFESGAAYIRVDGINVRYFGTPFYLREGSQHITIANGQVMGGRYAIEMRDGVHDVLIDHVDIDEGIPPWVARNDAKRPSNDNRPAHQLQDAGVEFVDGPWNVEIRNSTFENIFDAIDATKWPHNVHVHHNSFHHIVDDVMEIGTAGWQVEVDHNEMIGVNAGTSWNGSGKPPSGEVGTKYIHNNIIDASIPFQYGRYGDTSQYLGPNGDGMATGRAFGNHSDSSFTGADPWKVYNNTIVNSVDIDSEGMGVNYPRSAPQPSSSDPQEVYNNIFIQVADGYLVRGARVSDGSDVYDGNLYYHAVKSPSRSILETWVNGSSTANFKSLSAFKSSSYFTASKQHYSPGFEASGVEVFSMPIDSDYRPVVDAAKSGGVDLSKRGWPGTAGMTYRGAIQPGTSGTIGPQATSASH